MILIKKAGISWLLLVSSVLSLRGQHDAYVFRHLTTADGLASNYVGSIVQDSRGFMWLGTENGLQRYDGYSFTSFHHEPLDPETIDEDRISLLLEDANKNIWIRSHSFGFNLFDPYSGRMLYGKGRKGGLPPELRTFTDAFTDDEQNVWFAANHFYLIKFDPIRQQFSYPLRSLPPIDTAIGYNVCNISYDPATGDLWSAALLGMRTYNMKSKQLFDRNNNPGRLPVYEIKEPVNRLFRDRANNLWISTQNYKLFRYNLSDHRLTEYHSLDGQGGEGGTGQAGAGVGHEAFFSVNSFLEDRSGTIWMAAYDSKQAALLRYDPSNDKIIRIAAHPSDPEGLQFSHQILSLYEDREGDIWVSTDKGINIFNPNRQKFFSIRNDPRNPASFPKEEVTDFLQLGTGDIWISTWGGGLAVTDSQFRVKKRYFEESALNFSSPRHAFNLAWSLLEDSDGKIWAGYQHGYLSKFDPLKGRFDYSHPSELDQKTIMTMAHGKGADVWMALYTALGKWDATQQRFIRYDHFIPYHGVSRTIVYDVLPDPGGSIWVATEELGLQHFDPVSERFTESYMPDTSDPFSVSSRLIDCMVFVNDSVMAIGTGGGGIDLFNTRTRRFTAITTREGLPSNTITALYFLAPSDLWVATRNGLCRLNLDSRRVVNYGLDDGIIDNDLSVSNHFYKLRDGRLLLGDHNGFVYFNPDKIAEKDPPPDVKVTEFQIFDRPIGIDSLLDRQLPVSLTHEENFITIRFASFSYFSPRQTTYYYQLEGVDKDWVKAGNQRFAIYTSLPGGHYVFKVKCVNRNGIACKTVTSFPIILHPPFWNTWWFYTLCLLGVGGIAYSLYYGKINGLKVKQDLRNKIARDLHDDIGSSLSGINIYSRLALEKIRSGQEGTGELLTRISDRSEKMMDALSDIVWSINTQNDDTGQVLATMKEFAAEMLEPQKIHYSFEVSERVYRLRLDMNLRKEIYLIFKEAINNAAKYAKCSYILIRAGVHAGVLQWEILDDGVGFDTGRLSSGNGIVNMKERAGKIHGTLRIDSIAGEGTRVFLSIRLP